MTGDGGTFYGYQGMYHNVPVYIASSQYSHVDFPQGYNPTPEPDGQFKDDWDYNWTPLTNGFHDIQHIRAQIKALGPGSISALADMWYNAYDLLYTVSETTRTQAEALHNGNGKFAGWSSPAADEFLRWGPGATLYSLKQWQDCALNNAVGLRILSGNVHSAHSRIDWAWKQYVAEAQADYNKLTEGYDGPDIDSMSDEMQEKMAEISPHWRMVYQHQTAIWRKWSHEAQKIAHDLSQQFYQQIQNYLIPGRGTRFEGPTNAVVNMPGHKPFGGGAPPPGPAPRRQPRRYPSCRRGLSHRARPCRSASRTRRRRRPSSRRGPWSRARRCRCRRSSRLWRPTWS
ncbi:hypothetical protein ACFQX7_11455 [Luedemannella flava]